MIGLLILRLKLCFSFLLIKEELVLKTKEQTKNIFIFLGADYGNLGDVAITYAQIQYIQKNFPDYDVVEIPISKTYAGIKCVKKIIKKNDIITIIGGGNISDLYDDIEFLRQLVILNFRKYKIVSFPQSIYFTNTFRGFICKTIAYYIYGAAKDLTLIGREEQTKRTLSHDFSRIKSAILPDVVFTLNHLYKGTRKGALICLRKDKESTTPTGHENILIEKLVERYGEAEQLDTETENVNTANRFVKLRLLIENIQRHEFVITDRLHGMILCFITGTPALVLDNSTHKVSACYQQIKDCGYIKLMSSISDIETFKPTNNFKSTHERIIKAYKDCKCLKFH